MRRKRFLLIALALLLAFGTSMMVFATDEPAAWAKPYVDKAIEWKILPEALQANYAADITREKFCVLVMTLVDTLNAADEGNAADGENPAATNQDKLFSDTDNPAIIAAYDLGIVTGRVEPADGAPGLFDPEGKILRQEAAAMLTRAAVVFKMNILADDSEFADNDKIADYAKGYVKFVSSKMIMEGTGNNEFSPVTNYTIQQSVITMVRLYNVIKGNDANAGVRTETGGSETSTGSAITDGTTTGSAITDGTTTGSAITDGTTTGSAITEDKTTGAAIN